MITLAPVDPNAPKYELTDQEQRVGRRLALSVNAAMIAGPIAVILTHLTPCHVEVLGRLAACH